MHIKILRVTTEKLNVNMYFLKVIGVTQNRQRKL